MSYNPLLQGIQFQGASRRLGTSYINNSGSTIAAGAPVAVDTSSNLVLVDVSDETTVKAMVGYAPLAILNLASGSVVSNGRLENIVTGFAVGTPVWVGATPGTFTDVEPDVSAFGWSAGMFVIFVGVVVKNETNPSNQDIQLFTQIIGQL